MFRLKFSLGSIRLVMLSCLWRWSCMLMNIRQEHLILNQLKEKNVLIDLTPLANYFYFAWSKGCQNKLPWFTYYLLTDSEVITGKSQTEDGRSVNTSRPRSERFPCKQRTDEVNNLSIKWPFHYGPEPAINENQQLVSGNTSPLKQPPTNQPRSTRRLGECVRYVC